MDRKEQNDERALPERLTESFLSRLSRRGFMSRAASLGVGLAGALALPGLHSAEAHDGDEHGDGHRHTRGPLPPPAGPRTHLAPITPRELADVSSLIWESQAYRQIRQRIIAGASVISTDSPLAPRLNEIERVTPLLMNRSSAPPEAGLGPTDDILHLSFDLMPTFESSLPELGIYNAPKAHWLLSRSSGISLAWLRTNVLQDLKARIEPLGGFSFPDELAEHTNGTNEFPMEAGHPVRQLVETFRRSVEEQRAEARGTSAVSQEEAGYYSRTMATHAGYPFCCSQPWTCEDGYWLEEQEENPVWTACHIACEANYLPCFTPLCWEGLAGCHWFCDFLHDQYITTRTWICTDWRCWTWMDPNSWTEFDNLCYFPPA